MKLSKVLQVYSLAGKEHRSILLNSTYQFYISFDIPKIKYRNAL